MTPFNKKKKDPGKKVTPSNNNEQGILQIGPAFIYSFGK